MCVWSWLVNGLGDVCLGGGFKQGFGIVNV